MKHPIRRPSDLDGLAYNDAGLVPVIAQDEATGAVLMLAWADKDALTKSLDTGRMTYWSRSRKATWTKGETSGHTQQVVRLAADCDKDAVLAVVHQHGPACHEETGTCWTDEPEPPVATWLGQLDRLALARTLAPAGGYTDTLLKDAALAAEKVEEEAAEVAAVLRGEENEDSLEHEAADLLYHLVVALHGAGGDLTTVLRELRERDVGG